MPKIGTQNKLRIMRKTDHGLFLDGEDLGDILLPKRYVPKTVNVDDEIEVFIFRDSEDRLCSTTQTPYAEVDQFACLKVVSNTPVGSFLDWGMPKDLLVPFREQKIKMREGEFYVVRVYLDRVSKRLAATCKLDKFLDLTEPTYQEGEAVELMICAKTDLGFKAIINDSHWGMIFHNEAFRPLKRGEKVEGFIKQSRADGKVDLCLQKPGYEKVTKLTDRIVQYLQANGGSAPLTNKTDPAIIYDLFDVSKKTYKQAVGALYKKRIIELFDGGIRLTKK